MSVHRGVAGLIGTVLAMIVLSSSAPSTLCSGELLADTWLPNGSQALLADPVRPFVYRADFSGDSLEFLDSDTGAVIDTIAVGLGPSSVAMSGDGSLLYVALSAELDISVVDIDSRTVVRSVYLGFAPFSVTVGRPDRLYVSSVQDQDWRIVDELDGTVLRTMTGTYCPLLEASPDGDTLIVADCQLSPVKVKKYRINTDNPALLAEDDHDLGSYLQQFVVDWNGGVIYMASGAPYGIETMSLTDLSRTGFMPCEAYTAGVALSPDRTILYAMNSNPYDSAIWVYALDGQLLLDTVPLASGDLQYLEVCGDGSGLFVSSPLLRMPIVPVLEPGSPSEDAVLAYTPSWVETTLADGLPRIDKDTVNMSVDGTGLTTEAPSAELFRGTVSSPMAEGTHYVNVSAKWYVKTIWSNWTFVIDSNDPLALHPELEPSSPAPGEILSWPPESVSATITAPSPPPIYTSAQVRINDTLDIDATIVGGAVVAELGMMLDPGTHRVEALLWYDFGSRMANVSWEFIVSKYQLVMPQMIPVSPSPESVVHQSPEYVEIDVMFGEPEIEVLWLNMSLDGTPLETEFVDEDTFRGTVTQQLQDGDHFVTAVLVWDIGTAWLDWIFYLTLPWELRDFDHDSGFSVPVPVGWTRLVDQEDEDGVTELEARGPIIGGITTTMVVDTDTDSSLEESEEYMGQQIHMAVEVLEDEGIDAHVDWVLYAEIDGEFGAVFLLDLPYVQASALTAVVVSEADDRFWMIMLVFSSSQYDKANATFELIVDGFEVTITPPLTSAAAAIIVAVVAAAVAAPVYVYLRAERRKRGAEGADTVHGGDGEEAGPMAPSGYCNVCGTAQPMSNVTCVTCGRRLPSPPFGADANVPGGRGRT